MTTATSLTIELDGPGVPYAAAPDGSRMVYPTITITLVPLTGASDKQIRYADDCRAATLRSKVRDWTRTAWHTAQALLRLAELTAALQAYADARPTAKAWLP